MKPSVLIITGPSGVGKTTLVNTLLKQQPCLRRVITYTTRFPRPREVNHRDYHFVTVAEFDAMLKRNAFFEHAIVYGDFYGNTWKDLKAIKTADQMPIMIVDVQGAQTLKKKLKGSAVIFLAPDSIRSLESRLRRRRSAETSEQIKRRLNTVEREMSDTSFADCIVVNRESKRGAAIREIVAALTALDALPRQC